MNYAFIKEFPRFFLSLYFPWLSPPFSSIAEVLEPTASLLMMEA